MNTLERELKRGTLELLLLRLLADRPTYGYDLARRLKRRSDGRFALKEGTLYPVLYRLEDAGWVEPEWEPPGESDSRGRAGGRGVPRKYYRLTTAGKRRVAELTTAWESFRNAVDAVLDARGPVKEDA